MCRVMLLPFCLLFLNAVVSGSPPSPVPQVTPAEAGFNEALLDEIAPEIETAIAAEKLPGCVVCIGRRNKIALLRSFGQRRLKPSREPMSNDTVFDLASLTKPIATATCAMQLVEQGKLKLAEPVATYLPAFAAEGKQNVTVEQLFIHTSGLIPDNPLRDYEQGPAKACERIMALKLQTPAGERFAYSDVNYLVLAEIVKAISGQNIHEYSQEHLFVPLGMRETRYLPTTDMRQRAAPTQERAGHWMQGEVHDPRAFLLEGVAGHAGLFSTAEDLAIYASALLGRGEYAGVRVLKEASWEEMLRARAVPGRRNDGSRYVGKRALGWDVQTGYSSNRGEGMSETAFGHGGFTGTGIWIDPQLDLFVIFLSNRVHPSGTGNVNPLIGRIGTIAVKALK